jgi:hypothetical protein
MIKFEMSKIIDNRLWLEKENRICTQVKGILESKDEKISTKFGLNELNFKLLEIPTFIESAGTHWGVTVNIEDKCKICRLPLAKTKLYSFKCGHSFHLGNY